MDEISQYFQKFRVYAREYGSGDLSIERLGGFYPSRTSLSQPLGRAAAEAVRKGFGKELLLLPRMGAATRTTTSPMSWASPR